MLLALAVGHVAAGETDTMEKGKSLHDAHCQQCHGTEVYTRPDHKIDNRAELEAQVKRCAGGPAGVTWGPAQMNAVTDYLAQEFHDF